jgi:hypothetical protein
MDYAAFWIAATGAATIVALANISLLPMSLRIRDLVREWWEGADERNTEPRLAFAWHSALTRRLLYAGVMPQIVALGFALAALAGVVHLDHFWLRIAVAIIVLAGLVIALVSASALVALHAHAMGKAGERPRRRAGA